MGRTDILHVLFGSVLIPPTVEAELSRPTTPEAVREFIRHLPQWMAVRAPSSIERIPKLDPGEQAAISLAMEIHADLILLDDADGRKAASQRGLSVIGLLGILERAGERQLLDLSVLVPQIPADYRIDRVLLDLAVQRSQSRHNKK